MEYHIRGKNIEQIYSGFEQKFSCLNDMQNRVWETVSGIQQGIDYELIRL